MKEFKPLITFVIRDYLGNKTNVDLDMSTSLIKEIKLGEDCGDQTLSITLSDGSHQYVHAGSFDGLEEKSLLVLLK